MAWYETISGWFDSYWPHLSTLLVLGASAAASHHAVVYKRDVRAAAGWAAIIWLVPGLGPVLYWLLGINRIRRKAVLLRGDLQELSRRERARLVEAQRARSSGKTSFELSELAALVDKVTRFPLVSGNSVLPLVDGEAAYGRMLGAIAESTRSVCLQSYIFDNDRIGRDFVEALAERARRGVEVRVLVDDAGARYSHPAITHLLEEQRVRVARFMPVLRPARWPYLNLRNHRKILVIDGRRAFTGGMNIRQDHLVLEGCGLPTRDVHFAVEGPVVGQLQQVFCEDWWFTTGERLEGEAWFPELEPVGGTLARAIADGPDEDLDKIRLTLLGALSVAKKRARIVTPYFLPDSSLVSALDLAALRGVEIDIVVPRKGNLAIVEWAMWGQLWQILKWGCRIWLSPRPFDHSKLMVVDDAWALIGSANWDPRSLRLNFELDLECYDQVLARELTTLIEQKIAGARQLMPGELSSRGRLLRARDGMARLLTPYL